MNITSKPHLECIKAIYQEYGDQYRDKIRFMFTVTSNNDKVLSFWEPGAPNFEERLACLKYAFDAGFKTRVFIEPMLEPENVEELVGQISPYVSMDIWIGKLHHAKRIKGMFPERKEILIALDMLETKYTDERLVELFTHFENNPLIYWKSGTLPNVLEDHPLFKLKTTNTDKLARKIRAKKKKQATKEYEIHPAALAFPEMGTSAFEALKKSIKENGLHHPIVLHEGKIIDGKHRYKACLELGIEPKTETWDGKGSLTDFISDMNINRRDVTKNQRYAIALKLKNSYAKEAKERQRLSKGRGKKGSCTEHKPIDARKMACRKAGVSEHSLSAVQTLHEKARDLFDAVFDGYMALSKAMKLFKQRENPEYFDDLIGRFYIDIALPKNTWVSDVRLDKSTQFIEMKVRHESENGLTPDVIKQVKKLKLERPQFHPLDDLEKHMEGQITREELEKRALAQKAQKQMAENVSKFQGNNKVDTATPKYKTVDDARKEAAKRRGDTKTP